MLGWILISKVRKLTSNQDEEFTLPRINLYPGQNFICSAPINRPDGGTEADKRVANPGRVPHSSRSCRLGRSSLLLCVFQHYLSFQNGKFHFNFEQGIANKWLQGCASKRSYDVVCIGPGRHCSNVTSSLTLHCSFSRSLWFQWIPIVQPNQGFKMLQNEVHLAKFLGPLFEIWQPWHPFFDRNQKFLVYFKQLVKIMEENNIF